MAWLLVPIEVEVVVVALEGREAERGGDKPDRGAGPISRSGNVMKNKQPNVVPKNAPSTEWNLLLGGVYRSWQLGQKSLTVSWPGVSERPTGSTLHPPQ